MKQVIRVSHKDTSVILRIWHLQQKETSLRDD